ncbi:hypothetical protein PsYK624_003700 [Phanerochaete sordida]|uniref:Uncharacterized protein n=1 Tax=Phanerochaete sordida TaxID=48140 RepID=A0A9P3L7A3_9APHY|nr:hypothetical protein PsYK624_003700 [Phanerochaete sordida]
MKKTAMSLDARESAVQVAPSHLVPGKPARVLPTGTFSLGLRDRHKPLQNIASWIHGVINTQRSILKWPIVAHWRRLFFCAHASNR